MEDTVSLRQAAPQWTLAGDKQLLGILEKIHKKIMTKCHDTTTQLDTMVDALDDASVDLQNVNNKFMALSNSQFVESRVYDDDIDLIAPNVVKPEPQKAANPSSEVDVQNIKEALKQLQLMHEPVHIVDSDTSDDEEPSIILKPKDVYAHRPLPYIIGSAAWKSKWHAGLLPEESDSDSSTSKHEQAEEFSESEPEAVDVQTDKQRTISSSSSLPSEEPPAPQKPADIAAELARRLAGHPVKLPAVQAETIQDPPEPTTRKAYGIEKPAPATIFSDEPPPLDAVESDYFDDDIFAELHKKPAQNKISQYSNIADDLFGDHLRDDGIGNVVDDYDDEPHTSTQVKSQLYDDRQTQSIIQEAVKSPMETESNIKKPVGGISLFGSNKGTESIGAAILKRNQRKSSTSDEGSDVTENIQTNNRQIEKEPVTDSKKIIEELFAKPEKKNNKDVKNRPNVKPIVDIPKPVETSKATDKIDLFSDNLFDDIDDIFTTNVITKSKIDKNAKSIFDDDDLFSEITPIPEKCSKKDTKSIFGSDNDLFTKKTVTKVNSNPINVDKSAIIEDKNVKIKENKVNSIFDDDSDDGLFSTFIVNKSEPNTNLNDKLNAKAENSERNTVDDKIKNNESNKSGEKDTLSVKSKKEITRTDEEKSLQSPNLFDDDDYDLFNTTKQMAHNVYSGPLRTDKVLKPEDKNVNNTENTLVVECKNNLKTEQISGLFESHISKESYGKEFNSNKLRQPSFSDIIVNTANESNPVINLGQEDTQTRERVLEEAVKYSEGQDLLRDNSASNESEDEQVNNDFDNVSTTQLLAPEPKDQDLFSDIFNNLPPAFEKPSEPKKSKNVNALFDDDSDDESLFFKKNCAISDEKPDVNYNSDRFGIFHDEPPDIEVDFAQKSIKKDNQNSLFHDDNGDISQNHSEKPTEYVLPQDLDDPISKTNLNTESVDVTKLVSDNNVSQVVNISKLLEDVEEVNTNNDKIVNIVQTDDVLDKKDEIKEIIDTSEEHENKKPIRKLQPMNFNINVNTLLPGASPKKSRVDEETDGQTISTKSNEELNIHSPTKAESKMVKSVSFDGDPDSGVLDNKLSKERAKIQVKRRPSSRRARLEAVRKSGMEFGSDSTDNSSSFDEPKPKPNKNEGNRHVVNERNERNSDKNTDIKDSDATIGNKLKIVDKIVDNSKIEHKTEVKSKVVYILNDEDIFCNASNTEVKKETPNKNIPNMIDNGDDDDLFKTGYINKDKDNRKLGPTQKENSKPKTSLFDSDDDEKLFANKKVEKVKKPNIFDSDSDDELFASKKKTTEKKEIAKGPLFDDESDDDDLFSTKSSKALDKKPQTSKANEQQSLSSVNRTEPVFEDPLSMLGDNS